MFKFISSTYFTVLFALVSVTTLAQKGNLDHESSRQERELIKTRAVNFHKTGKPVGTVRAIAEWEAMEGAIIAYDKGGFGIPLTMIKSVADNVKLYVLLSGASEESIVRSQFKTEGVNLDNIVFIHQDPDAWWTRDYSPWPIAVNEKEVALVDFPYNRPRPHDDNLPYLMANELGIDYYGMEVKHCGGNFMCDGYNKGVSTDLVYEENATHTEDEVNQMIDDYLGIDEYFITIDPPGDYIKHVDCWGKFLDVDKILVAQVPEADTRYKDFEAVADFFATQNCSWGYPYEVYRVKVAGQTGPDSNPYTNTLILNDKVYVTQSGSKYDKQAVEVYKKAMPGYEIIPVFSTKWLNTDALHCRIHGVADREMIHITHQPLNGAIDYEPSVTIEANVTSYGGDAKFVAGYPKLYYSVNEGEWKEVSMTNIKANAYEVKISGLEQEDIVRYYIKAENDNKKVETLPVMNEKDPFTFYFDSTATIVDVKFDKSIKLYPNLNHGTFSLITPYDNGKITIYSTEGKQVFNDDITNNRSVITTDIENRGYYVVKIEQEGKVSYRKIVIK